MYVSLRQKIILSLCGIGMLSLGLFITGLFYSPTKSIADRSGCTPQGATPITGNGQAIGTFTCPTYTPTPTPSPTPKPTPTALPTQAPTQPVNTAPPPKGSSCGPRDDNGVAVSLTCRCVDLSVVCKNGKPFNDDGTAMTSSLDGGLLNINSLCGSQFAPGDGRYCIAKPVIYLYPLIPTFVNVNVQSEGKIVVSDPHYPSGGWKNVMANPNGKLAYQGKEYSELFYESEVNNYKKPTKGIIIKSDQLQEKLGPILEQLGLIGNEKEEFLTFWLPRLQALKSPYIFFSILDASEKERLDTVMIDPKPTTSIAFIAYFKPIATTDNYDGTLQLPSKPQRKGFVSVEWGGSLDVR